MSGNSKKQLPKWLKWLILYLSGIVAFVVGQALMDMSIIGSKWWIVTPAILAVYWFLFIKTTAAHVEGEIKYDWDKKK
jgi:hypothetical protein